MVRRIFIFMMCLTLSSCVKQKHSSLQHNETVEPSIIKSDNDGIVQNIIQQEAMLIDVPIPLYNDRIIPVPDTIASNTLVFGYKSSLNRNQALSFFMNEMERYGWQHLVSFESDELIMQFCSPYRFCTIVIKDIQDTESHSSIFIYIKKDEQKELLV